MRIHHSLHGQKPNNVGDEQKGLVRLVSPNVRAAPDRGSTGLRA